ncbi:hypothetical protein MRX96_047856 [Rhipicephalus microplus]
MAARQRTLKVHQAHSRGVALSFLFPYSIWFGIQCCTLPIKHLFLQRILLFLERLPVCRFVVFLTEAASYAACLCQVPPLPHSYGYNGRESRIFRACSGGAALQLQEIPSFGHANQFPIPGRDESQRET